MYYQKLKQNILLKGRFFFPLFALFTLLAFAFPYAQTKNREERAKEKSPIRIDWDEIRSSPVGFENYSKKPAPDIMRTLDRQKGEELARKVQSAKESSIEGLQIRRIFDPAQAGLGADILSVSKQSNFGHINRLQRLIEAYLESGFDFSKKDARTASRFILYYNAHKRNKLDAVKKRYSKGVIQKLDPKKMGIDRSYRNWAGKTELLLPLRKNVVGPGGTDLNLGEISRDSGRVPKGEQRALRETEKNRDQQEIKKLDEKERELEERQKKSKKEAGDLQQSKRKLGKEGSALDERLKRLRKDPKKNAKAIEEAEKKQRELQRRQRIAEKKSKELEKQQKEDRKTKSQVAEQRKETQARTRETASKASSPSPQKTENNTASLSKQKELEKLKAENERLKAQKEKNLVEDRLLFMRVVRYTKKGHYRNELWYLDANKDDTLFQSPFKKICSRDFRVIPKTGVVVTGYKGEVNNKTDHHLVLLDLEKLKKIKESRALAHWRTPLILRNNKLYVFTQKGEKYYLARMNTALRIEAQSKDSINPYSEVTFYKDKIYLTGQEEKGAKTTIQVFKMGDLNTLKVIKP